MTTSRQPPLTSGPHTDQCIADAARYGFCDHTRLTASSLQIRFRDADRARLRLDALRPNAALPSAARETAAWIGLAAITGTNIWLFTQIGWKAVPIILGIGAGWLLVFTCGIPRGLQSDLSRALPPDAREKIGLNRKNK